VPCEKHGELVAPDPRHQVALTHCGLEDRAKPYERFVARGVSKVVVSRL
jgi:hypothetical protein